MTVAKYLYLADSLPEIAGEIYCEAAQLIGAGVGGGEFRDGNFTLCYGPLPQPVAQGKPVTLTLLHWRGPDNDNNAKQKIVPSKTAAAAPAFMQSTAALKMPSWVQQPKGWHYIARHKPEWLNRSARGGLKVEHSNAAVIPTQPSPSTSSHALKKKLEQKRLEETFLALYLAAA